MSISPEVAGEPFEVKLWTEEAGAGSSAKICIRAPFHPMFTYYAQNLDGRWIGGKKTWKFHVKHEELIRRTALRIFGTDGIQGTDQVEVMVFLDGVPERHLRRNYFAYGRIICVRTQPAVRVKLGHGVELVSGGFELQCGHLRMPLICPLPGTILKTKAYSAHPMLPWNREDGIDEES